MPKMTIEELKKMRESAKKSVYLREGNFRGKVIVHMGTCGIAAGAREILSTFLDEISSKNISDIMCSTSGCAGLCSMEPMVTVEMSGSPPVKYGKLTSDKAKRIFAEHILKGTIVNDYAIGIGSERAG